MRSGAARLRFTSRLPGLLIVLAAGAGADEPPEWFAGVPGSRNECTRHEITATELLTLREIGGSTGTGLNVSPDGRYVAFEAHRADLEANTYKVGWFLTETEVKSDGPDPPMYAGDGGDPLLFRNSLPSGRVVGAWISPYPKWSPDSQGIAYRKSVDGITQIWWSAAQGGPPRQLSHNAADVEDFYWSSDSSRLFFVTDANREDLQSLHDSRRRDGYVFDDEMDWSTIDGKPYFPAYELTGGAPVVWLLERQTGRERLATDDEVREFASLRGPGPRPSGPRSSVRRFVVEADDGHGLAWLQADDPEKQGVEPPLTLYASTEPDASVPVRCPAEECSGPIDTGSVLRSTLNWNTVDGEIIFVRKEGVAYSKRTVYGWQPGADTVRTIFSSRDWISDCSVIADRAVCFQETPTQPRTIVSIDLVSGSLHTLVDPNPGFRCVELGRVEPMEWVNAHGYETFGYLVLPPDFEPGRRYPLVFVGYRARYALRGGVGNEYPVHLLARNGFVVLVYEKPTTYAAREVHSDRLELGRARWGRDPFDGRMPLSSFESAIEILSSEQLIDPARVAVTGLSNGAAHVNYALIHSDMFAAAIVSSIEFSPSGLVLSGVSGEATREFRKAIGAGPYPGPDGFAFPQLSLSLNASRVNTPLLINVSDHEHPWALAEMLALVEAGKPIEMVVYPDEGHIKWQPAHRASVYQRNVDWLRFWLQGVVDNEESKTAQYARWNKLKQLPEDGGKAMVDR